MREQLLGACVESFGLYHQFLGIQFRTDAPPHEDVTLSISSQLVLEPPFAYPAATFSPDEQALLFFSRINLLPITGLDYFADGSLALSFSNGYRFYIQSEDDYGEPWQLSGGFPSWSIIGSTGGGMLFFPPLPPAIAPA